MSFRDLLAAAERGAASVYHAVLATGADVLSWEQNPVVGALVQTAVGTANGMLTRAGVPAGVITVVEHDIHAALKTLAVFDSTVSSTQHSLGSLSDLAGAIATAIDPNDANKIEEAVAGVHVVETVTHDVAEPQAEPEAEADTKS